MRIEKVRAKGTYHSLTFLRPGYCLGYLSTTSAERSSAALIDRLPNFSQLFVLHWEKRLVSGLGSPKIYVFDLIPDHRRGAADKHQRYGSTRTTERTDIPTVGVFGHSMVPTKACTRARCGTSDPWDLELGMP